MQARVERSHLVLLAGLGGVLLWSAIRPRDYFIWFLEVLPAAAGVAVLAALYHRFRFSNLRTSVYGSTRSS